MTETNSAHMPPEAAWLTRLSIGLARFGLPLGLRDGLIRGLGWWSAGLGAPRESPPPVQAHQFGAGDALFRIVDVPAETEANLQDILALEVDRQSPFKQQDVVLAWRVMARSAEQLRVLIGLVPRQEVPVEAAWLTFKGAEGQIITPSSGGRHRPPPRTRWRGRLVAAALLGMVVMYGVAFLRLGMEEVDVAVQMKGLERQALEVSEMRQKLSVLQRGGSYPLARKQSQTNLLEMLRLLTRELDDQVWLSNLQFRPDDVAISGFAPAASDVLRALQNRSEIDQASFTAPITLDRATGKERFALTLRPAREVSP